MPLSRITNASLFSPLLPILFLEKHTISELRLDILTVLRTTNRKYMLYKMPGLREYEVRSNPQNIFIIKYYHVSFPFSSVVFYLLIITFYL